MAKDRRTRFLPGLPDGKVAETLIVAGQRAPNVAALGLRAEGDHFVAKIHAPSVSFRLLLQGRRFGVHAIGIDDVGLLARAALSGPGSPVARFSRRDLQRTPGEVIWFLADATGSGNAQVVSRTIVEGTDPIGRYRLARLRIAVEPVDAPSAGSPLVRGSEPILEALVAASRIRAATPDQRVRVVSEAVVALERCRGDRRVPVRLAVSLVEEFLGSWFARSGVRGPTAAGRTRRNSGT